mmetsp:Transcript_7945/g.26097  ORF Transcript_7945/g.26097 Transcript_7945/m.26097 type:complete len:339 (-) Transcript_7945:53-1069(-)
MSVSAGCIDLFAEPPDAPTTETRAEKEKRDAFVESLVGLDSVVCNALLKESGVLDPSERVKALKHLERVKALKEQELEVSKRNSGLLRVEKRKASRVSELPLVNVLTALVAGGAPSRETVKDLLDVLGIVGGLMLSIAVGPPLSLDVEAYEQIVDRFDKPPYDDCGFDGADLIKRFNFHCANAYSANAAALFSTLVVYVCFVTAGDDWYGKEWKAYWNCMRLPIILALLISVVGCLDTINAVKHYMIMTMPNPRVEHDGRCRDTTFRMREGYMAHSDTWGYNYEFSTWSIVPLLGLSLISMSLATSRKHGKDLCGRPLRGVARAARAAFSPRNGDEGS